MCVRERECESVCVCVREREWESVCACVCERVCVIVHNWMCGVLCRYRILFRLVFNRIKCCSSEFLFRAAEGSYVILMHSCVNNCCIHTAHLSPTLNGSSKIQYFERNDMIEIHNGIIFHFYTG